MENTFDRKSIINRLKIISPKLLQVTSSDDMGYEFHAMVPSGVIFSQPGMLLSYSGGSWPPDSWNSKSESELNQLLKEFLLDEIWKVTPWHDLTDDELIELTAQVGN